MVAGGDPCGVGPEVILKAVARPVRPPARIVLIGDLAVFEQTAKRLRLSLPSWTVVSPHTCTSPLRRRHTFIDVAHPWRFVPGQPSARAGAASLEYLDLAIQLLKQGRGDALVTAPVTKWAMARAPRRFEGHTEYLAQAFGVQEVVMMFVSESLRVALMTRHLALREVPSRVTRTRIRQTILMTAQGLERWFSIRHPRLAVCGLNPHAGEGGRFGDEERRVLRPILRACRERGMSVEGPFAADGFFRNFASQNFSTYDAVLCWYHDQGLIPFKLIARDRGCQLTLGLPIVRTSPDHGSALDIAGQGRAHPGSMRYAIALATKLARAVRRR